MGIQQNMYYVHTDHLGSYNFVMDASKNIIQSCHFDPWGNRKLYNNWSQNNTASSFLFSRGFTNHEHLDVFKIINMNARLYDPVLGRFFSPDPIIQDYEATQTLNRYSYCQNNPVNKVDVDGRLDEWVETEGEMKYDSRVIDQKTAIEFYGKDAIYRPIGYQYYDANDKQVILLENGKWSYTGQIRPDPECPTCGENNSNTIDWKLFQKGVNTYKPLLKAAEISLEISATLLSGSIGFEGLVARKMYLYHYTSEVAAKNISKVGLLTEYSTDGYIYLTIIRLNYSLYKHK